jgi:hypothetical protein
MVQRKVLSDGLIAVREKVNLEKTCWQPISLVGGRWLLPDIDHCEALFASGGFGRAVARRKRDLACSAPDLLNADFWESMDNQTIYAAPTLVFPAWLSDVARRRALFAATAFRLQINGQTEYWKFIFAILSPMDIWVGRLTLLEQTFPSASSSSDWHAESLNWHECLFEADFCDVKSISYFGAVSASDVFVLDGLSYSGGKMLFGDVRPVLLSEFLLQTPLQSQGAAQPTTCGTPVKTKAVIAELPWVEKDLFKRHIIDSMGGDDDSSSTNDDVDIEALDEDAFSFKRWQELEDLRSTWEHDPRLLAEDFKVRVLGGEWTWLNLGRVADAISGQSTTDNSKAFCVAYGLHGSIRCDITLYSVEHAASLARAWCNKLQHFLNISLAPDFAGEFTAAHLTSWVEPPDFQALRHEFVGHKQGLARVKYIVGLLS